MKKGSKKPSDRLYGNLTAAGITHVGLIRAENQDRFLIRDNKRILVVADGMGGHNAGSTASQLFVDFFDEEASVVEPSFKSRKAVKTWVDRVVKAANAEIYLRGRSDISLWGMGTTGVALVVGDDFVHTAHVGDSRIYRLRGKKLKRLTKDHSQVQELVDRGELSEQERHAHPKSHIVTRFIGDYDVRVEHHAMKSQEGDIYLLCSDGLTDVVRDEVIEAVLLRNDDARKICTELIDLALKAGAPDNVTVVVAVL